MATVVLTFLSAFITFFLTRFYYKKKLEFQQDALLTAADANNTYWAQAYDDMNNKWVVAWERNLRRLIQEQQGMIQKIADGGN